MQSEERKLTVTEALNHYEDNPQAAALALGMVLMQHSNDEVNRINNFIRESDEEKIRNLEIELDFWRPLGQKWLALKNLLGDESKYNP